MLGAVGEFRLFDDLRALVHNGGDGLAVFPHLRELLLAVHDPADGLVLLAGELFFTHGAFGFETRGHFLRHTRGGAKVVLLVQAGDVGAGP